MSPTHETNPVSFVSMHGLDHSIYTVNLTTTSQNCIGFARRFALAPITRLTRSCSDSNAVITNHVVAGLPDLRERGRLHIPDRLELPCSGARIDELVPRGGKRMLWYGIGGWNKVLLTSSNLPVLPKSNCGSRFAVHQDRPFKAGRRGSSLSTDRSSGTTAV